MNVESVKKPGLLFYACGLASSAIALILIYFLLALFDLNVTGLYVIVIPVGAIVAGAAAGSGYFLISRILSIRVSKKMILSVFIVSLVVYAIANYVTFFADTGETAPGLFFRYLQEIAENSSMTIGRNSRNTIENLGVVGYVFMVIEFIGFAVGSTGPLLLLSDRAYCKNCQQYLRLKNTYHHMPELEKGDVSLGVTPEEKRSLIATNNEILKKEFDKLKPLLQGKSLADNEKTLASLPQAKQPRSFFYLTYAVTACPKCDKHQIAATLNAMGIQDYSTTAEEIGTIEN
jgi:hypothetical protein